MELRALQNRHLSVVLEITDLKFWGQLQGLLGITVASILEFDLTITISPLPDIEIDSQFLEME